MMRKLFVLALCCFGSLTCATKAAVVNLSSEEEISLERAANIILRAQSGKEFEQDGVLYHVVFSGGERIYFDQIIQKVEDYTNVVDSLKSDDLIEPLEENDLNLICRGVDFSVSDGSLVSSFKIVADNLQEKKLENQKRFPAFVSNLLESICAFSAYLKRDNLDQLEAEAFLKEVENFGDEKNKAAIYSQYLESDIISFKIADKIANLAMNFEDEICKSSIYSACFRCGLVCPEAIERLVIDLMEFKNIVYQTQACVAYLESNVVCSEIAKKIVAEVKDVDVLIAYLRSQVADFETAKMIVDNADEIRFKREDLYAAYILCSVADFETVKSVLAKVQSLGYPLRVHSAYLESMFITSDEAENLILELMTEEDKNNLYTSYFKCPVADLGTLKKLIGDGQSLGESALQTIFTAYLNNPNIDLEILNIILDSVKNFRDQYYARTFYVDAIESQVLDYEVVENILSSVEKFEEWNRMEVYVACIIWSNIDLDRKETLMNEVRKSKSADRYLKNIEEARFQPGKAKNKSARK